MRAALILIAAAALAGCTQTKAQPEPPIASQPVYCYKTLANPVCYAQPRNGEYYSLLNYEGPAPQKFGYSGQGKY